MENDNNFAEFQRRARSDKRKRSFPLFRDKIFRLLDYRITEQNVLGENDSDIASENYRRLFLDSLNGVNTLTKLELPKNWIERNRSAFARFGAKINEPFFLLRIDYGVHWWLKIGDDVFRRVSEWTEFDQRELYLADRNVENGLLLDWKDGYSYEGRLQNYWEMRIFGEKWSAAAAEIFS